MFDNFFVEQISVISLATKIATEADAYAFLESLRWGGTPVCPHCGESERVYFLTPKNGTSRATRTGSASQRRVWKCGNRGGENPCGKQFSVLTGTIFHGTKIPVRTWLFVIFEMCSSKNGVSAREIERKYDLTAKSAWFLTHRIREAMKREPLAGLLSGVVVADETFIGGKEKNKHVSKRAKDGRSVKEKTAVLSLIETNTGEVRSVVVPNVTGASLGAVIRSNVNVSQSLLQTDEWGGYRRIGRRFAAHGVVSHRENEYVRYEGGHAVTTNQAEGYFSQLKRSLDGTHHHVSVTHLPRYLAEFDFRYSTRRMSDTDRMGLLVSRVGGRRLTYRQPTLGG